MGCGGSKSQDAVQPLSPTPETNQPKSKEIGGQEKESGCGEPWTAPAGAVYHRITKIPIKPGSMPEIKKTAEGPAMQETMKSFKGFLGVEALAVDDTTMLTHSRWVSEEACSGGAAALGTVLKEHLKDFIAGPPDAPWVGPRAMELKISDAGPILAYRVVIVSLQEGTMQSFIDFGNSKLAEFKTIEGLVSITGFQTATGAVMYAGYTSKAAIDAATPKINGMMKEGGAYFSAPPIAFVTEVEFSTFDPLATVTPYQVDSGSAPAGGCWSCAS